MGSVPPQLSLQEILPAPTFNDEAAVGVGVGGTYLVVELPGCSGPCWVCAPASPRAIDCVREGVTSPWTVLHRSTTGTVDVYRTGIDGALHCSTVLCASLPGVQPAFAAA
ncbi:MAG TPA: hypothetical protein VG435_01240 [Acidimicrobiales bacterium]|nr:hypothetical protein [Acidimicrobiales bacterium]